MADNARAWREPSTVAQQNEPLHLFEEIKSIALQDRWSTKDPIQFCRRTLEVALEDAIAGANQSNRSQHDEWERTADLAKKALDAVLKLTNRIGPSGLPTAIRVGPSDVGMPTIPTRVSKTFAKSGKISLRGELRKTTEGRFFRADDAKEEASQLVACCDLLKSIHQHASDRQKSLLRTRVNDADHAKRAFVYRLAEAWIFLTGNLPAGGRTPAKNQFLRFVDTAAKDANRSDVEDFFAALTWARDTLQKYESFAPDAAKQSRQCISGIRQYGPAWAEGY